MEPRGRDACLGALWALAACGGGGGGTQGRADVLDACAAVEDCDYSAGVKCRDLFDVIVPTPECTKAIEETSCEDYTTTLPPWMDACFPPCGEASGECHDDGTLTQCDEVLGELRMATADCEALCRQEGFVYFAACGETFLDQKSETGLPVCWCSE